MTHGKHNLSAGFDIRDNRGPTITTNSSNGSMTFSTDFTHVGLADYLLGAYTSASALSFTSPRDYRFNQYALFVQDDYKLSSQAHGEPRIAVGVRPELARQERRRRVLRPVRSRTAAGQTDQLLRIQHHGAVDRGGRRAEPGVMQARFDDFAPRVGFAYRVRENTVLRGGYGIFYAMNQGNDTSIAVNPGASVSIASTNSPGQIPRLDDTLFDNAVTAVTGAGTSLSTVDSNRKTPNCSSGT